MPSTCSSLSLLAIFAINILTSCQAFSWTSSRLQSILQKSATSTQLYSTLGSGYSNMMKRRNVKLPLLEITDDDTIIPLPAAHLPMELSTLQVYGMTLTSGMQKTMITDTLSKFSPNLSPEAMMFGIREEPTFGCIVEKKGDSLVGAIGCAGEIVVATPSGSMELNSIEGDSDIMGMSMSSDEEQGSGEEDLTLLYKGSFRFVVKEVVQEFPFPIAIVDEVLDDPPIETRDLEEAKKSEIKEEKKEEEKDDDEDGPIEFNDFEGTFDDFGIDIDEDDDEEDEDDEEDIYEAIDSTDLIPRTMAAMKSIVDQKLDVKPQQMSPLEESILRESGVDPSNKVNAINAQRNQAEEMAAIFQIFASSMIDIAPTRPERLYAVAIMATEFAALGNDIRKQILTETEGVARLRMVLKNVEEKISLAQAKKITDEITEQNDEESRDLKVGKPSLPPWAKSIKKGTKIEYFWNETEGWCNGVVTEDPVMVVDELLITVLFDDGETHKLPFQGIEKARWRPAGMGD